MIFCFETQTKNELTTYCKKVYLIVNNYIISGPHIYFLQVSKKIEKNQMYQKFYIYSGHFETTLFFTKSLNLDEVSN